MNTCTFQVNSKYDSNGQELSQPKMRDCGQPGGTYRIFGQLSTIRMTLCDFHRNYVTNTYKWKCEHVEDENGKPIPEERGPQERLR
jgi:hypothetical protein